MTRPVQPPAYRLKIPCGDELEFRQHFVRKYVTSGIFVPSRDPRPVGTRVRVKLELRNGQVLVSGDAIVTSRTPTEGSDHAGMTMRLTALHPESIQFELSPSAAARAPASPPPASATPTRAPLDRIFDADEEPAPAVQANPAPQPVLPDDSVEFSEVDPTPRPSPALAPLPDEPVSPPALSATPPRPTVERRRIAVWIAAGVAIVAAVAALAVFAALRVSRPRAPDAVATAGARVAEELRIADTRLLEGRLAGPGGDSALDHLLSARAAAPDDPRVTTRLGLLADKFEEMGDRALARRNLREAEVHFAAALRAAPLREGARRKLAEVTAAANGATPSR